MKAWRDWGSWPGIGSFCGVESQVSRPNLDHIPVDEGHLAKCRAAIHQRPARRAVILESVPARSLDDRGVVGHHTLTRDHQSRSW